MSKSPDAFRTISEVADWLGIPAHVLRFWESKFTQIKPVKRAGGRRYYRPADMLLLGGIKCLLHDKGMSIKEVQALLRDQGIAFVSEKSASLDDTADPVPMTETEATVTNFPTPTQRAPTQMQMHLDSQPEPEAEPQSAAAELPAEPMVDDLPGEDETQAVAATPPLSETVSNDFAATETHDMPSDDPGSEANVEPEVAVEAEVESAESTEADVAAAPVMATARPTTVEVSDTADDAFDISRAGVLARLASITSLPQSSLAEALICAEQLRAITNSQSNPTAN